MSEFMRVDPVGRRDRDARFRQPARPAPAVLRATKPRGYLGWGKSHQLGTGLGLAIGAKVAAPDKFCVNFMGDAAFGMTGLDFETAVRCGIPITTIVLNNSTMAIETHAMNYRTRSTRRAISAATTPTWRADLGGWSERVDRPGEVANAILRARRRTRAAAPPARIHHQPRPPSRTAAARPERRRRMPQPTVAIVGAGIGGVYLAAELGLLGCRLRLHDRDSTKLDEIGARGGIDVEGERAGFAAIERATTDPAAAVDGADIIVIVTGGTYQEGVARSLAPLLRDGQLILLVQGNTGGALVVRRALDQAGCRARVDIAEMDNYPYSSWRLAAVRIRPIVRKRWLQIAAFPGDRTAEVFARLSPLFPEAVAAPTIASTGFMNANAMLHVANCVGNAGRIDHGGAYKFYADGVTQAVARLYRAINTERVAAAAAFGASVPSLEDWFERVYGVRGANLGETCRLLTTNRDGPYQATGTPKSWDHKYIAEDVPVGLMPMSALAAAAGVPTPAIDSVIRLATVMAGNDFAGNARTLERMGLAGMNAAQIQATLEHGFQ